MKACSGNLEIWEPFQHLRFGTDVPLNLKIKFRCSAVQYITLYTWRLFCITAHCTVHAVRKVTTHHSETSLCTSEPQNFFSTVSTCKTLQHGMKFNKTRSVDINATAAQINTIIFLSLQNLYSVRVI